MLAEPAKESCFLDIQSVTEVPANDVVKFDIISSDLDNLNKLMIDNFDYTNDYPEYHPHTTIAYVLPGKGKKYEKDIKNLNMESKELFYSFPGKDKKKYFVTQFQNL